MRMIQTLNDIEYLKASEAAPMKLIKFIESDLLHLFNAESPADYLFKMRLPRQQELVLIEAGDPVIELFDDPFCVEYVENYNQDQLEYYKICKRMDHEFSLYYVEALLLDEETRKWLAEQVE